MKITAVLTFALATTTILLSACSTDLTKAGSRVRLLNSANDASNCQVVKTIYTSARFAANNAVKKALNKAADAGANAFYIISSTVDAESNETDIVGNALICK